MTATAPIAAPSPAPSLAFGIGPDGTYTRVGQTAAFILGTFTMLAFFPLAVVAALLYTRAETRFAENPARARALVTWSWLCIGIPVAIGAVIAVLVAAYQLLS
ncbi:hypothetical protein HUT06_32215 [Actinomadura sp. NAK00032]|uniref:hypothetical protein n=1 Tax=Actinomadura sp. NAK00032 TaxID=2742128 RepID=UPI0015904486|nr:hypothetical protein [Actinomadura sp. NAK00032]QKW38095.1 hypothetical protein HUT06_32215 [Actinomadura sp. NAK00032]